MSPASPLISVVVPVFNHWLLVPGLLECMRKQALPGNGFELLLVDNGSDTIPRSDDLPGFARVLVETTPGSYAARNRGVASARGSLLAFTDADCRPSPVWLRELVDFFKPGVGEVIVAGGITIVPANTATPTDAELYDMVMGIPQAAYVHRGYGVTANLAMPKELFERMGGFDPCRYSGGDAEFCRRASRDFGVGIVYCPPAVVEHPARDTMESLVGKVRRICGGQVAAGPLRRRVLYAIRAFMPPVRAWRRALGADTFTLSRRLTVCRVQARLWLAGMTEVLRLVCGKSPERR